LSHDNRDGKRCQGNDLKIGLCARFGKETDKRSPLHLDQAPAANKVAENLWCVAVFEAAQFLAKDAVEGIGDHRCRVLKGHTP
jgi:hypothetical protein